MIQGYTNFNNKSDSYLDYQEFNWDLHVIEIFEKYIPKVIESINNMMNFGFSMTKNTYGENAKLVDTTFFRDAMRKYLQNIMGIRDDCFPYFRINKGLIIE